VLVTGAGEPEAERNHEDDWCGVVPFRLFSNPGCPVRDFRHDRGCYWVSTVQRIFDRGFDYDVFDTRVCGSAKAFSIGSCICSAQRVWILCGDLDMLHAATNSSVHGRRILYFSKDVLQAVGRRSRDIDVSSKLRK